MKKLVTLVLCAMMLFSAVMPVTTLAKTTKCTPTKEVVKVVKKATCTEDGKVIYPCKKCGKLLKTSKVKKVRSQMECLENYFKSEKQNG